MDVITTRQKLDCGSAASTKIDRGQWKTDSERDEEGGFEQIQDRLDSVGDEYTGEESTDDGQYPNSSQGRAHAVAVFLFPLLLGKMKHRVIIRHKKYISTPVEAAASSHDSVVRPVATHSMHCADRENKKSHCVVDFGTKTKKDEQHLGWCCSFRRFHVCYLRVSCASGV